MKTALFILLQKILPQHFLSCLVGYLANWRAPKFLLMPLLCGFVKKYQVDMSQAKNPDLNAYPTFNHFFTRHLQTTARPIGDNVVAPADGCINQISSIVQNRLLQAKGSFYTLEKLLANESALVQNFSNGSFATIYLAPRDYHRVHMPYGGKLLQSIYVPGKLFSVNPITVKNIDNVFARNERLINIFETDRGPMAVILVGAMLVAGIHTTWQGKIAPNSFKQIQQWNQQQKNIRFATGDELGYFNFGSTVIVLFAANKVTWAPHLAAATKLSMGETIGR